MYGRGSLNATVMTRPRLAPSPCDSPTRIAKLGAMDKLQSLCFSLSLSLFAVSSIISSHRY